MKQIEVDERKELTDDDVIKIIQKQVKQRNDAMTQYKDAGRDDLYDKRHLKPLFLKPICHNSSAMKNLESALRTIITEVGATSIKEIGKVMGAASKTLGSSSRWKTYQ